MNRPAGNSKNLLLCIGGALLLMAMAFYNGYPLYMGDTHAYMNAGFNNTIPPDRSPFYGWFIRHSSLKETLWLTILTQNLVLSFLLLRYYKLMTGQDTVRGVMVFLMCTVSFTYVSWVTSCLQPDAFTPVLLLGALLYLQDKNATRAMQVVYITLAFIAITMHNSHFLIVCIVAALLFIYSLVKRMAVLTRKAVVLMGAGVLYFVMMCSINAANNNGFVFSRASDLFLVTKFAETGILNKYLDDNCGSKQLRICQYKEEITPFPWDFMFGENSIYGKMGGHEGSKEEFSTIIKDVMTTPKYLKMYGIRSVTFTLRQISEVHQGDPILMLPRGSAHTAFVKDFLPNDAKEFGHSRQNGGVLDNGPFRLLDIFFFIFSSITVVVLYPRIVSKEVAHIYLFVILFYVVNAFVTATVSTVESRYSYRIFWLLPATNAALILNYLMALVDRRRFEP